MPVETPNELSEPAVLARQMSSLYCGKLRARLTAEQMADLVERMGDPDREHRCASERYGINSGELMREVLSEVTGVKTDAEEFSIDTPINERQGTPRYLMLSAFWWNRREAYWPPADAPTDAATDPS